MPTELIGQFEDRNQFIDRLPGYDLWYGTDILLDQCRGIEESGEYIWMGVPFPTGDDIFLDAYGHFAQAITVPPYSYCLYFTGYSQQPEGFKVRIFDKGAKVDLFASTFANNYVATPNLSQDIQTDSADAGNPYSDAFPIGPYLLTSPNPILAPGAIQLEITNMSQNPNTCQIFIAFGVPVTNQNLNIVIQSAGGGN